MVIFRLQTSARIASAVTAARAAIPDVKVITFTFTLEINRACRLECAAIASIYSSFRPNSFFIHYR